MDACRICANALRLPHFSKIHKTTFHLLHVLFSTARTQKTHHICVHRKGSAVRLVQPIKTAVTVFAHRQSKHWLGRPWSQERCTQILQLSSILPQPQSCFTSNKNQIPESRLEESQINPPRINQREEIYIHNSTEFISNIQALKWY